MEIKSARLCRAGFAFAKGSTVRITSKASTPWGLAFRLQYAVAVLVRSGPKTEDRRPETGLGGEMYTGSKSLNN